MIKEATQIAIKLLNQRGFITHAPQADIDNAVRDAVKIFSGVDVNTLTKSIEEKFYIWQDDFTSIDRKKTPWLLDKKAGITWSFWNRYEEYLREEKNIPANVIGQVHKLTDATLDKLFDPTKNRPMDKRGLVVGQVQSGKTSNYTGLICKAADAGFKFIIVLAGIHNNLRSQTQLRLDEGFLGFDTQHQRAFNQNNLWIGVGQINQGIVAHSLTSSQEKGDFTAGAANSLGLNFNTNEPIVVVVKKNTKVLERLLQWLNAQSIELEDGTKVIRNKSLLLIDDEADNASINTNRDNDPSTRINGLIRNILRLFERSGYVGYTATPFANIFIPITEDDLFPRDFIINLPAPSNYIGPDKVFGFRPVEDDEVSNSVLPVVNRISDYFSFLPDRHKKSDLPDWRSKEDVPEDIIEDFYNRVPDSLVEAIKSFIITCSIRRLRGQAMAHNSMLVHISRFQNWQKLIARITEKVFDFYRKGIEMNIPSVIEELRATFEIDNAEQKSFKTRSEQILSTELSSVDPFIQVHAWEDVLEHLHEAATKIVVREINGGSADTLNYFDHPNGLSVIAIGGDKLSRGLTLEGLSVSYYLRASRMYDTLMQMGRWFGYRPGYVDLCRLYTSRELNEWFCHITLASEELRNEFDYMSDVAGSTPEKFALKVRTHPGVLQISASNKIRRAVTVDISWAGRLVESYEFQKDPDVINSNLKAAEAFIGLLPSNPITKGSNSLWYDVDAQKIKSLLQKFKLSENLKAADPVNLLRFIDAQLSNGELTNWRVALMSKNKADKMHTINKEGFRLDVGLYSRKQDDRINSVDTYYIMRSHIISPNHEFIDLSETEKALAMERTIQFWREKGRKGEPTYISGEIVRNEFRDPRNPLLLLYFLDPKEAGLAPDSDPIVGYAISFPGSRFNAYVNYAIHEQLLPLFNIDDNFEEMQYDED
ncbi:Z1 domain-containing protein [Pontibacter sp. KCTC 32443]|uniref:Z1 domain-containing protein n=1 Tax=Pontibacter TaxID=323449 RepID=UPI00164DC5C3|nr:MULTISPECIES: Z1 domain-containing protein [Pontibacter]MBC5774344.1 Z1 domain-containing protein [Pontibacter sp. KCTC 32443]